MNVALLTCEKLPDLYVTDQFIIPALEQHGITAKAVIWDDESVNWLDFDCLLFRNIWDYFEKEQAFNAWLNQIQEMKIPTLNSLEIVRQNEHKFYLRELQYLGIPIIKTIFIEKTSSLNLHALIPSHWKKAVIKPAFSGGAYQTKSFNVSDLDLINAEYKAIAAEKDLLLQEFMPEVQTAGETSFIFFNKSFSHAINKKPATADFRVQVQFGGIYTTINPSQELIDKAKKAIDTFEGNLLYARVDGIVIQDELYLMEIECIEPDLYFEYGINVRESFVTAILELLPYN